MRQYSALFVFFLSAITVQAQFSNGQAARAVFGQQNFSSGSALPSQTVLGGVSGLAYFGGTLYVADSNRLSATPNDSRILAFQTGQIPAVHADVSLSGLTNSDCYLCGFPASLSIGQTTFAPAVATTGFLPARTQSGLANASGVAIDGHYFAVADTDNNRVLLWNEIPTSMGQPADLVLGQANFTSFYLNPQPINSSSLRGPQGVWIQNHKLFVADTENNRVLIWNSIPTQNNQAADLVLGQNDFTHNTAPSAGDTKPISAANQLLNPTSVTSDGVHLLVSDLGFNRVLIWNAIPTAIDQNADVVVGQLDMASNASNNITVCNGGPIGPTSGQCQASLNYPRFALSDGTRLFVADGGNDRVLIWNTIPTTNGAKASTVLGQPDFLQDIVSSAAISIASTAVDNTGAVDLVPTPQGLAFDGTNLYVSDPYNRRVVVFTPGDTILPPNSIVNWASEIVRQEGIVSLTGTTVANDTVTVTIAGTAYVYTIKSGNTLDDVAIGVVGVINASNSSAGDPNATATFAGAGTGTIYLSSKATDLGYDTITLAATASSTSEVATASGAYLSAGTAATGAIGMLVEINGTNLSDQTVSATLDGSAIVPHTLGGVQVFMDGAATPIFKASPTQIITQIPYYFNDRNSTSVFVRTTHNDGSVTVTNAMPVYISAANPGIFNAPAYAGQPRPWPVAMAFHQSGNPTAVVSIDGSVTAANIATITIQGTAYSYTVVAADTLTTIATKLAALINASDPYVTASLGGAFDRVVLTAKKAGAAGYGITVAGSASTSATVTVTAYSTLTCCVVTPGSLITPTNPAGPGELITVTGVGLGIITDPTNVAQGSLGTGVPYTGPFPNTAQSFVTATIGTSTAQTIFADLPKQSYGIYNMQIVVPTTAVANTLTPMYVAQNAFISNTVTLPVGPTSIVSSTTATTGSTSATPTNTREVIDVPALGSTVSGTITASGWALSLAVNTTQVGVYIDGAPFATADRGVPRPDVCASFTSNDCPAPGWGVVLDTTQFADGPHTISITSYGSDGTHYTVSQAFNILNQTSAGTLPLRGSIDVPAALVQYRGVASFSGWALNDNSSIASVSTYVDGAPQSNAIYGAIARPDVCALFPGRAGCPNVGWSFQFDTGLVANGSHVFTAKAVSSNGQSYTLSQPFLVSNFTGANSTLAVIDSPAATAGVFSGMLSISGWALNANSTITTTEISVDGVSYGVAAYGGFRTDVCAAEGNYPGCPNVGFNALLDTTFLSDGGHTLTVTVTPAAGQSSTYTRAFAVANQGSSANPVLAVIDTPSNGSSVSGQFSASGWALSTVDAVASVQVLIDGKSFGNATPTYRADVCAAQSSPGCPNVGWSSSLQSTELSNGLHVLEITVTTVNGHRASAGTTFKVANPLTGPGHITIDSPTVNSNPFLGQVLFRGWAFNDAAGVSVSSLSVTIDGVPYGTAAGNGARADVCAVYPGRAGCPNVGWSFALDTTKIPDGNHTFGITANYSDGTFSAVAQAFVIANYATANPLRISIDTPAATTATAVFGDITVTGWAQDNDAILNNVIIAVDGFPVGTAIYGITRTDVCTALSGQAGCPNVGFTFSYDTSLLANGVHTIAVTGITQTGQSSTTSIQISTAN